VKVLVRDRNGFWLLEGIDFGAVQRHPQRLHERVA
jgi:hypothetical protein